MDILSYKLGKNASGGGGGGGEEKGYVYPLPLSPDEIIDTASSGRTIYAGKLLIFSVNSAYDNILPYISCNTNKEYYFSDGTAMSGSQTLTNYEWDTTKDIDTPYGKKRVIVEISLDSNTKLSNDMSTTYQYNNIEYAYVWGKSNYTYFTDDLFCYAKNMVIGNENTSIKRIDFDTFVENETIYPYNVRVVSTNIYSRVKELDFSNASGEIDALNSTSVNNNCLEKIILGSGTTSFPERNYRALKYLIIPKDTDFDLPLNKCPILTNDTLLHIMKNIKDNSSTEVSRTIRLWSQKYTTFQTRYVKEENGDLVWCNSTDTGSILATTYITNKGWTISN